MDRVLAYYFERPEDLVVKPITQGLINQTYEITLGVNRFILQQINTSVFEHPEYIISNMLAVSNHLQMKDYPKGILRVLPNLNCNFLTFVNEEIWRMTNFIPNSICLQQVSVKEQAYNAAQALGQFHRYLNDFDATRIKPSIEGFLDYQKRIDDYKTALVNGNKPRIEKAQDQLQYINAHLHFIEKYLSVNFPQRIVHADAKISNFLFDAENSTDVTAVIDWDTLIQGNILCDFGDMVRTYANLKVEDDPDPENNFSIDYYHAVKDGFTGELQSILSEEEIELIDLTAFVVILIQAIRFVTDYLTNDTYYQVDYDEQNLNRTINQMNLLKSMQAQLCIN